MDVDALLAGVWNVIVLALAWLRDHLQSTEQQLLFAAGVALMLFALYAAWRAQRIMSYKIRIMMAKLGFLMIMIAIGWDNAKTIYNEATQAFGSPLAGILAVFAAGMFGMEIVKMIVKRKHG